MDKEILALYEQRAKLQQEKDDLEATREVIFALFTALAPKDAQPASREQDNGNGTTNE